MIIWGLRSGLLHYNVGKPCFSGTCFVHSRAVMLEQDWASDFQCRNGVILQHIKIFYTTCGSNFVVSLWGRPIYRSDVHIPTYLQPFIVYVSVGMRCASSFHTVLALNALQTKLWLLTLRPLYLLTYTLFIYCTILAMAWTDNYMPEICDPDKICFLGNDKSALYHMFYFKFAESWQSVCQVLNIQAFSEDQTQSVDE